MKDEKQVTKLLLNKQTIGCEIKARGEVVRQEEKQEAGNSPLMHLTTRSG